MGITWWNMVTAALGRTSFSIGRQGDGPESQPTRPLDRLVNHEWRTPERDGRAESPSRSAASGPLPRGLRTRPASPAARSSIWPRTVMGSEKGGGQSPPHEPDRIAGQKSRGSPPIARQRRLAGGGRSLARSTTVSEETDLLNRRDVLRLMPASSLPGRVSSRGRRGIPASRSGRPPVVRSADQTAVVSPDYLAGSSGTCARSARPGAVASRAGLSHSDRGWLCRSAWAAANRGRRSTTAR